MSNIILRKSFLALPSLAALTILGSSLSVNAQTAQPETIVIPTNPESISTEKIANQTITPVPETAASETIVIPTNPESISTVAIEKIANRTVTPQPGTVETSSVMLNPGSTEAAPKTEPSNQVAQADIQIGRGTRGVSSYVGVGGNIGLTGNSSALGDGNFAFISKIGVTKSFSARPSVILGDDTTILIPITYDFSFPSEDPFSEPLAIAPYLGLGAAIKTGNKSETAFLVTGGIDVPLNSRFTATAAINAGFFSQTDVGILFGVGYNFSGF